LARLNITFPVPHLRFGNGDGDGDDEGDGEDGAPQFITDATMHLFSSTADFVLKSPLSETSLEITKINATALYKGDEVGRIEYDEPFEVPPGQSTSPKLPVDWNLGSVGYDAVRKALGGTLKIRAEAEVGVRIGLWEETIWYTSNGIGAKVRL
jgi:hypothetical protein